MKMFGTILLLGIITFANEPKSSEEVIHKMYSRYNKAWYKTLTFVQKNEFYKSDTIAGTSIWYEAIEYPKNFRIDIGEVKDGNAVIFRNDSIYSFRGGELKKAAPRRNDLTFLLGGMYFVPYDTVLSQLRNDGYDLSKGFGQEYKGRNIWVVGANSEDEKTNQLWIDQEHLYIVRIITFEDNKKVDAVFEGQKKLDNGWCETKVTFLIDDELVQIEYYNDVKVGMDLNPEIFNPNSFGKVHWMAQD